jgi:hypothetical protein
MPLGLEMKQDSARCSPGVLPEQAHAAAAAPEMTAYEVGQRVQEYIRGALPLFEPMEMDYNGGALRGDVRDPVRAAPSARPRLPKSLQGRRHQLSRFESPLHDAIEQKGQQKGSPASKSRS